MACLVSLSLSVPICSLQNPVKVILPSNPTPICFLQILTAGAYSKKSAFCKLPGLGTPKTASDILILRSSKKGMSSVNGENDLNTMSKHFDEIVSCSSNASCCTCIIIRGYWVGPDIDDGCGFVEASICRSE